MRDLKCDPATLAGPIDERVARELYKHYPLGNDFLACMTRCHGGRPAIGTVAVNGTQYRVAEFLTLLDEESELEGDFRPHFEHDQTDERVVNSIPSLMDGDDNTSRCLFEDLVPFAATQTEMHLDRAYVDLFCFDCRGAQSTPRVVLWNAAAAVDAYFEWDALPLDDQFDNDDRIINLDWESFLVAVAPSFRAFVEMLTPNG